MLMIRDIRKDDYIAIDRLLLQLHRLDVAGRPELFLYMEHYMSRESFESLVGNKDVLTILAENHGEILGCCFVSFFERSGMVSMKTAYIDMIVVDEKHRRNGIGNALFQAVQKRAKQMGARRIDLMVWNHNQIAIEAYDPTACAHSAVFMRNHCHNFLRYSAGVQPNCSRNIFPK